MRFASNSLNHIGASTALTNAMSAVSSFANLSFTPSGGGGGQDIQYNSVAADSLNPDDAQTTVHTAGGFVVPSSIINVESPFTGNFFLNFHELEHAVLNMAHYGTDLSTSWMLTSAQMAAYSPAAVAALTASDIPLASKVDYWQEYGVASGYSGVIQGDDRNNSLIGRAVTDTIDGGAGNDTLLGDAGADTLTGGSSGADTINGQTGNDSINGQTGNDTLRGGQDNDIIHGGQDNDQLFGDLGNDTLYGDLGVDTLTGGGGADTFYVGAGDVVLDFNAGEGDFIFNV